MDVVASMAKYTYYKWDIETVDAKTEEVLDHNSWDAEDRWLREWDMNRLSPPDESRCQVHRRLVLVRDELMSTGLDRAFAYVNPDGTLPEYFEDEFQRTMSKVPVRFHRQLEFLFKPKIRAADAGELASRNEDEGFVAECRPGFRFAGHHATSKFAATEADLLDWLSEQVVELGYSDGSRQDFAGGYAVTVRSPRPCGERLDADFGWMEADSVRLI